MKVYISLPITGYDLTERRSRAAELKERALRVPGITSAVTPFEVCQDVTIPYNECMGMDIAELLSCDGIILDDHWDQSPGCKAEKAVADIYNIPHIDLPT